MNRMENDLPFALWDEDGLIFDSHPELFVLLNRTPILWTVRGVAYFSPRFQHIGTPVAQIQTAAGFKHALDRWLAVERQLLLDRIEAKAHASGESLEYRFLQAVVDDNWEQAEKAVRLLEHRQRTGLKLV